MVKRINQEFTGMFTQKQIEKYSPLELTYLLIKETKNFNIRRNILSGLVLDLKKNHRTGDIVNIVHLPHQEEILDYNSKEVNNLIKQIGKDYFFYIPIEKKN